jgi:hypothetical protein
MAPVAALKVPEAHRVQLFSSVPKPVAKVPPGHGTHASVAPYVPAVHKAHGKAKPEALLYVPWSHALQLSAPVAVW